MASNRRQGIAATAMVALGVILMVVPPLARDGICGIFSCADRAPSIGVTRTGPDQIAVVVPADAADSVSSVRLLEGSGGSTGSRRWFIQRDGSEVHEVFPVGSAPAGFRTVTELTSPPVEGSWVAEVGFSCTSASLPFTPETVTAGSLSSWSGVSDGATFSDTAATEESCTTAAGSLERWLLLLGALLTAAGAVLGILVVLRRPVAGVGGPEDRDDESAEDQLLAEDAGDS